MVRALSPRGPDGAGLVSYNSVAFGQRRLKIFDLSEHAQQPMVDPRLGLTVVHNGAIYNYRELRRELESKGYTFFSEGDTEVVLKAYHAWGESFAERLNGMFAVAVLERDTGRVVLARDRLGIKPLYYSSFAGGVRFASTLPALLAAGEVDRELDPVALQHYLTFHSVVPAPRTVLRGVRKLPPATVARIESDGRLELKRYWTLNYCTPERERPLSCEEWAESVGRALRESVARRMRGDVEVGVLLSGGLDSSLLVALLSEAGYGDLKTFSVGFESAGGEPGDEFVYSNLVARRYGTRHTRIPVSSDRLAEALPACIAAMSEPMVSHDAVGFYLLAEEVSRHVKVVQSGQGADEIFAGYHWYSPLLDARRPVDAYAAVFFDRDYGEYLETVSPRYSCQEASRAFVTRSFAEPGAEQPVDLALRLDTTVMLVEDPVKRVDNMTMAWGLEARVPFLDHELVELAARIPAEYKVRGGGKGVLRSLARDLLPHEVIDRPKGYFPVPALRYLRGQFLDLVRDALESDAARRRGIFRRAYVEKLLASPEDHLTPLKGSKLWQLGLLELWLQAQGV
ncbi:MAG: asparagine synthetase B [Gemmatimonadales bacterium]|nr:MAG: asparagine synthetase B [Gemmatimonadales bacterium]